MDRFTRASRARARGILSVSELPGNRSMAATPDVQTTAVPDPDELVIEEVSEKSECNSGQDKDMPVASASGSLARQRRTSQ